MQSVTISRYHRGLLEPALDVLARAFVTNPVHVAAFGPDELELNRRFFQIGLERAFSAEPWVAEQDGAVRGFVHYAASPRCLGGGEPDPETAKQMQQQLGDAAARVAEWFGSWARRDPKQPHLHLGPIGVAPELQGTGAGSAMMRHYVGALDRDAVAGYLETDRPGNVKFYEKFGFEVVFEEPVLGVPNWYMWREPARGT